MLRLDAELNKDIIIELKKPLGKLYPDFEDAIDRIKSSKFLISVGDATFANLIEYELYPNLAIIDNLVQRKNYDHDVIHTENILKANNPAGTITDDLWETIGKALEFLMASEDTTILYGQPNEGLVVLNVSDTIDKAQMLIDAFIEE